jgi:hypothetical protein
MNDPLFGDAFSVETAHWSIYQNAVRFHVPRLSLRRASMAMARAKLMMEEIRSVNPDEPEIGPARGADDTPAPAPAPRV